MGRLQRITPKKPSKTLTESADVQDSKLHVVSNTGPTLASTNTGNKLKRKRSPSSTGSDAYEDDNSEPGSDYVEDSSKKGKASMRSGKLPKGAKRTKSNSSPSKPSKPPPTDPSTWRQSRVSRDSTITKGDAVKFYRLNAKSDFGDLKFEDKRSDAGYPMFLYNERDIERRAWEKHGSPEGFDHYLSKLKERHNKIVSNSPQKHTGRFIEPNQSVNKFEAAEKKRDRELASLEKEFPPWLWKELIAYLDRFEDELSMLATYLQYINPRLEKLRVAKKQNLQSDYPARPSDLPPSNSESFRVLEVLLAGAPSTAEEGFDWDHPPKGIYTSYDGFSGEYSAKWDQGFNDQVNRAVADIVTELGEHYKQHTLWMVYDAHARCIGGLGFVEAERNWGAFWFDDALKVFNGPLEFKYHEV